jgi:phage shock protein C
MARSRRSRRREPPMDKRVEHFAEEVGAMGERLGRRMEREYRDNWFHRTFGIVGPLISSVLGLAFFALFVWLMGFLNGTIANPFLASVQAFLSGNIGLFFLTFVFFSYTSYFSKHSPRAYVPFSPLAAAVGIAIGFWLAQNALDMVGVYTGVSVISNTALVMERFTYPVFFLALLIGYLVLLAKLSMKQPLYKEESMRRITMKSAPSRGKGEPRSRLYRSGRDRILGGVCGGLGEYFDVDPVIIRLLFVALAFAGGLGIILYIIAWIIIPRNPEHRWNR